eukprot:TRINITY_DN87917_c0_g1_i1.p1 TRINITY_DN87917_c0_g1~~TRINITY_DN87917_c0_g1_i1.p1  ORF type:complete len:642 (+),score=175.84 TRINITY_DN87917_c0_g1_i1:148-2073(+)
MGKGGGGWKGGGEQWDTWDTWDSWDTWGDGGKKGGKNQGAKGGGKGGKYGADMSMGKGLDSLKGESKQAPSQPPGACQVTKASSKAAAGQTQPGSCGMAPGGTPGGLLPISVPVKMPPAPNQMPPAPAGKGMPPMTMPLDGNSMPLLGKAGFVPAPKLVEGVSAKAGFGGPRPPIMPGQQAPLPGMPMQGKGAMGGMGPMGMRPPHVVAPPPPGMMVPMPPRGQHVPPPQPQQFALPGMAMPGQPVRGLAQEIQGLVALGLDGHGQGAVPQHAAPMVFQEKKPQLFMLIAQMAPQVEEAHMQQVLEQCGEVQAFRRGKDSAGQPMSFGVVQFGDPEAAWKASSCLNKRKVAGQEVKILLEENTENVINRWKQSQKAVLRVNTDEEMEWELERKAVSCKALIDAKLEELYGATESSDSAGGAVMQRRQELRQREKARVERVKKRKAWREAEFMRELQRVETSEKSLRDAERRKDVADRDKEEKEARDKQAREQKLEKLEADGGATNVNVSQLADNRALMELVDKVQTEHRESLFTVRIDPGYLRNERILERKLRPWLERKIDLYMGGQTSDLVEHIIRRVNGASQPDPLIAELERFLDDHAEPLVERLWRMLALELTQDGLVLPSVAKKAKKEEPKVVERKF